MDIQDGMVRLPLQHGISAVLDTTTGSIFRVELIDTNHEDLFAVFVIVCESLIADGDEIGVYGVTEDGDTLASAYGPRSALRDAMKDCLRQCVDDAGEWPEKIFATREV